MPSLPSTKTRIIAMRRRSSASTVVPLHLYEPQQYAADADGSPALSVSDSFFGPTPAAAESWDKENELARATKSHLTYSALPGLLASNPAAASFLSSSNLHPAPSSSSMLTPSGLPLKPKPLPGEWKRDASTSSNKRKRHPEHEPAQTRLGIGTDSFTQFLHRASQSSRPSNRPTSQPVVGALSQSASRADDILHALRASYFGVTRSSPSSHRSRLRDFDPAAAAASSEREDRAIRDHVKRTRAASASSSRSRSRSRSRVQPRPSCSSSSTPSSAESNDAYTVLQDHLRPLGLSVDALFSLSSSSIQRVADAIKIGSVKDLKAALANEGVGIGAPPSKRVVDAAAELVSPDKAAVQLRRQQRREEARRMGEQAHLAAHDSQAIQDAKKLVNDIPSFVVRRSKRLSAGAAAAAATTLSNSEEGTRSSSSKGSRTISWADASSHAVQQVLSRMEEAYPFRESGDGAQPGCGSGSRSKTKPLESVLPPSLVQRLLDELLGMDGLPPTLPPAGLSASTSASPTRHRTRSARLHTRSHLKEQSESVGGGSNSNKNKKHHQPPSREQLAKWEEEVRQRNKQAIEQARARKAGGRVEGGAPQTEGSWNIPAPPPPPPLSSSSPVLTPAHIAYYIQTKAQPPHPYTIPSNTFCRVLQRPSHEWKQLDSELQNKSSGTSTSRNDSSSRSRTRHGLSSPSTAASPTRPIPAPFPLSSSPFAFVTGADFLEWILKKKHPSPAEEEAGWLCALGFEQEWIRRKVEEGMEFRLAIFQVQQHEGSTGAPSATNSHNQAYPATWSSIFRQVLPQLLQPSSASSTDGTASDRTLLLKRLQQLETEITSTPWSLVFQRARIRGMPHVYDDDSCPPRKMSVAEAASLVKAGAFDVVEARRFLHDQLHVTCLFNGDGFTQRERVHSGNVSTSAAAYTLDEVVRFREYLVRSRDVLEMDGAVSWVALQHPLGAFAGRVRSSGCSQSEFASPPPPTSSVMTRSRSRSRSAPSSPSFSSSHPHLPSRSRSGSRSRSRSRSRVRGPQVSQLDTGLRIKPGTDEYERIRSKQLEEQQIERQKQEAEERAKREQKAEKMEGAIKAGRKRRALERKRLKAQQEGGGDTMPMNMSVSPRPKRKKSTPMFPSSPSKASGHSASSTTTSKRKSVEEKKKKAEGEEEDDYSMDEFDGGEKPAAGPSSSSSVLAAAQAAAGLFPSQTKPPSPQKKKKKANSKKRKTTEDSTAAMPSPRKSRLSKLPPIPKPIFSLKPTTSAANGRKEVEIVVHVEKEAVAASPPKSEEQLLAEQRSRAHKILLEQQKQRKKEAREEMKRAEAARKKLRDNLNRLDEERRKALLKESQVGGGGGAEERSKSASPSRRGSERRKSRSASASRASPSGRSSRVGRGSRCDRRRSSLASTYASICAQEEAEEHALLDRAVESVLSMEEARERDASELSVVAEQARKRQQMAAWKEMRDKREADVATLDAQLQRTDRSRSPKRKATSTSPEHKKRLGVDLPSSSNVTITATPADQESASKQTLLSPTASKWPGPGTPARVQRSYFPSPSASDDELQQQGAKQPSSERTYAASHDVHVHRLKHVTEMAAQLSQRFSSFLAQQQQQQQRKEVAEVAAASERHERVLNEIIPPFHLQQPFERAVAESSLDSASGSLEASGAKLLPGESSHQPLPQSVTSSLPHASKPAAVSSTVDSGGAGAGAIDPHVSDGGVLMAEHVPNAPTFLSALPRDHAHPPPRNMAELDATFDRASQPLIFAFPSRSRRDARPLYDLAQREYVALEERIKQQKMKFKMYGML